uniref:Centrosomal protein of 19 kDa n=1 Tax=Timema douglasi TaxID=61478 RepID=A0A7R8ZB78_TIMDO|nr:unnamed protein product [Timema douglasi]
MMRRDEALGSALDCCSRDVVHISFIYDVVVVLPCCEVDVPGLVDQIGVLSTTDKSQSALYTLKHQRAFYTVKHQRAFYTDKNQSALYTDKNQRALYTVKHQRAFYTDKNQSALYTYKNQSALYTVKHQRAFYTDKNQRAFYTDKNQSALYTVKHQRAFYTDKSQCALYTVKNQRAFYTVKNLRAFYTFTKSTNEPPSSSPPLLPPVCFQSEVVQKAVYGFPWYDGSRRLKTLVRISAMRSQKPLKLTAGHFYILSLETYAKVMSSCIPKRLGIRVSPPALVLIYQPGTDPALKLRQYVMPVRSLRRDSNLSFICQDLRTRHKAKLELVGDVAAMRMLRILQGCVGGEPVSVAVERVHREFEIPPDVDLNKLGTDELNVKKMVMAVSFEKTRVKPEDPEFVYDKQVDFTTQEKEQSTWDQDNDDFWS